jgi:hypothetical protein
MKQTKVGIVMRKILEEVRSSPSSYEKLTMCGWPQAKASQVSESENESEELRV